MNHKKSQRGIDQASTNASLDKLRPETAWQTGIRVFAEVTGWIAAPIIAALFFGRWLDQRYDSAPWLFLLTTALAFIITSIGIVRMGKRFITQAENESQAKKNNLSDSKQ